MIDQYSFGKIVVDGETYTSDVIIYPDRVDGRWWRKEGHNLSLEDLADVFDAKPQTLVVGQGQPGLMKVSDDVRQAIADQGIELHVAPTAGAVEEYNRLAAGKTTVAALHLTCKP